MLAREVLKTAFYAAIGGVIVFGLPGGFMVVNFFEIKRSETRVGLYILAAIVGALVMIVGEVRSELARARYEEQERREADDKKRAREYKERQAKEFEERIKREVKEELLRELKELPRQVR